MPPADRNLLLHQFDQARFHIEELLPDINPEKEIYPQWTIRHMLAHITGWDDFTIDALQAHLAGRNPAIPEQSIDEYNSHSVNSRQNQNYEHTLIEFRLRRQVLHDILEQVPENVFFEPLIALWGGKISVSSLVDMCRHHEEEHAQDIRKWLENPNQPLIKKGN